LAPAPCITLILEANGRLGKEAQKLPTAFSCAIVRMVNKHPKGTDASGWRLERRSIFGCVDCQLLFRRVTRWLSIHIVDRETLVIFGCGKVGFMTKRKQHRRPRREMHCCLGLLCRFSIIWSVCAREVSEHRLHSDCFYAGLSS
jgi:hypothetical protein